MPVTGVYFIPCNPNTSTALGTVVEQLRANYQVTPTGRWALEHKLLRDTPSCLPPSAYAPLPPLQPRSMQFLSLSHYQSHGFIYTSDRPDPDPWASSFTSNGKPTPTPTPPTSSQTSAPTSAPSNPSQQQQQQQQSSEQGQGASPQRTMMTLDPQSFGSFLSITLRACEPLWSHRHTVTVPSGTAFAVSDFYVRVGDVRQTQPASRVRGTIVEIEYRGPMSTSSAETDDAPIEESADQDILVPPPAQLQPQPQPSSSSSSSRPEPIPTDDDWEVGAALIREFWSRIAVPGAREAILVPGVGTESRQAIKRGKKRLTTDEAGDGNNGIAGTDLARQYMELFRFNR